MARTPGSVGVMLMASGLAVGLSSLIGILAVPALMLPGLVWCMGAQRRLH